MRSLSAPTRPTAPRRTAVAALVCLLDACAEPAMDGLDLSLVVDPSLNRVDQVLAQVDRLELVLDSEAGLYVPGEEYDDGEVAVRDADTNPADLELVARVPRPAERLPRVRLLEGGLPAMPFELRLVGYDADGTVSAEGLVRGITLAAGRHTLDVPFNLRPAFLPPRVADVVATPTGGCFPPRLTVVFSRPVDAASVLAPGAIVFSPGGAPASLSIDVAGRIATVTPPLATSGGGRIRFDVTVSSVVVDGMGEPLDQFPPIEGLQAYVGRYDVSCP